MIRQKRNKEDGKVVQYTHVQRVHAKPEVLKKDLRKETLSNELRRSGDQDHPYTVYGCGLLVYPSYQISSLRLVDTKKVHVSN